MSRGIFAVELGDFAWGPDFLEETVSFNSFSEVSSLSEVPEPPAFEATSSGGSILSVVLSFGGKVCKTTGFPGFSCRSEQKAQISDIRKN